MDTAVQSYWVPYGHEGIDFTLPCSLKSEVVDPALIPGAEAPVAAVEAALHSPYGGVSLKDFKGARSAAIAISDKTRPVPHHVLLPPLLKKLKELNLSPNAIQFFVATGLHPPMESNDVASILPKEILEQYQVICHDANDQNNLRYLGDTHRGTPIWVNDRYVDADLRIVVGNIEPHQFQGFSGGVKSAAIGLAGRDTINANHSRMNEPEARMGSFHDNPVRQDVEEIGSRMGIHFALNAILNHEKQIVYVLAGEPGAVMQAGIPLNLSLACVPVSAPFDLAIASAGGHPKDLNLYQSQKALAHASHVVKDGGTIILVAACRQGSGSQAYEAYVKDMRSHDEVIERFGREGFRVGPHKAVQIAQDASRLKVILFSQMEPEFVRSLLLTPAKDLQEAINLAIAELPKSPQIGIFPNAPSTIPTL